MKASTAPVIGILAPQALCGRCRIMVSDLVKADSPVVPAVSGTKENNSLVAVPSRSSQIFSSRSACGSLNRRV